MRQGLLHRTHDRTYFREFYNLANAAVVLGLNLRCTLNVTFNIDKDSKYGV